MQQSSFKATTIIRNNEDIQLLIELVRGTPLIYMKQRLCRRRRADLSNCWSHIVAQLGNRYTMHECRRKWKSLKDSYKKFLKQKLAGRISQWHHASDMAFLYEHCINDIKFDAASAAVQQAANHNTAPPNGESDDGDLETLATLQAAPTLLKPFNDFYDFSAYGIEEVSDLSSTPSATKAEAPVAVAAAAAEPKASPGRTELDYFFHYLKLRVRNLSDAKRAFVLPALMSCVLRYEK